MDHGWSLKQLHRLIMTSNAYKMASQFENAGDLAKDPENDYLWRFRMQRLDAEIVRDTILAVERRAESRDVWPAGVPQTAAGSAAHR